MSESDFSDSESSRAHQLRKSERKIRLSALSLLLHIVKVSVCFFFVNVRHFFHDVIFIICQNVSKKDVVGYWDNILSGPYSILKTLSNDASPRLRVAITAILSLLFSTGKMYISQAQHK